VARKKHICQLMDHFLQEKAKHYHKLLIDTEEAIGVIKSSEAMNELFSACKISPDDNNFMRKVTPSASNVVLNCEEVHKALIAIKSNNKCKCEKFFDKSVNGKYSSLFRKLKRKLLQQKLGNMRLAIWHIAFP
jgi:uncharacterized protein with ParB-like and HNH nuclease domain